MRYGKRTALWVLTGMAALGSAGNARAEGRGPQLWDALVGGQTVRAYTDGERAVGGTMLGIGKSQMQATLLGVSRGQNENYQGRFGGIFRTESGTQPAAGAWSFRSRSDTPQVAMRVVGPDGRARDVPVPLDRPEPAPTLRCGWALGDVTLRRAGRAQPLHLGDRVAAGDTIATGSESAAIVVLGDRSVAVMQQATTLVLPAGTYNGSGPVERVRVQGGKIWFAVRKLGGGEKFEVETGQAVAAVRGTEFVVEVGAQGESVIMADGTVELSRPGMGGGLPVTAGRRWDELAGAAPAVGAANLAPLLAEWETLLEIADYCWPFRRVGRVPFWQNLVKAAAPPGRQPRPVALFPDLLNIAVLVDEMKQPDPLVRVPEAPLPRDGGGQPGAGAGGQQGGRRQAAEEEDDENDGRRGRRKKGNGAAIGRAAGGLILGGVLGGLGRRGGGGRRSRD